MASFPRYTTYGVGELEETLRGLDLSNRFSESLPSPTGIPTGSRSPKGLLTRHSCQVSYPDGATGDCVYVRGGPTWHLFRYGHRDKDGKNSSLPDRTDNARIANTVQAIEELAQKKAADAFSSAIDRERKEYFQRASEGRGRKAKRERFQMKAARAKELSGKYALCRKVGRSLLPLSDYFDDLNGVVTAWEQQSDKTLVIACCNRLDRCWEEPTFNPLHGNPDYPCSRAEESQTPPPGEWTSADTEEENAESDEFGDGTDYESDDSDDDEEYLDGPHDDEEDEA